MRKLIICTALFFCFVSYMSGQDIVRRIIDSTKKELNTAKGNKRIDCLNLLAEAYYNIWDEDDKQLDTACMYTEEAYKLAKNSGYKQGLGYALLWKAQCYGGRVDDNRNNNKTEANYAETENYAKQAIKIGEEIKDYRLLGDIYNMLKWLERWKGDQAKFKTNVEKAIYYYEKPVTKKLTGHLNISQCDQCRGNEGQLGWLYQLLATIFINEGKIEAAKNEFVKAIHYGEMIGNKQALGNIYSNLRQAYFLIYDYKSSEEAAIKSISYYKEANNVGNEINTMNEMCKVYEITGDFEKGLRYGNKSIQLTEELNKKSTPVNRSNGYNGMAFFWMSRLYQIAGDYETSLAVIRNGRNYYFDPMDSVSKAIFSAQIGDVHRLLGNYDSAFYYLKPFEKSVNDRNNFGKISLGYLYIDLKEYNKALELAVPFSLYLKNINRIMPPVAHCMMIAGNAFYGEKKYNDALNYAREAQTYLKRMDGRVMMIANYKLLSDIFSKLNMSDSAYYYLKLHTNLKDSLINRQFYWKLNSYKKEAEEAKRIGQINLLQKDYFIKEQELQQQVLLKEQNEAQLALLDKSNEIKDQKIKEQTLLKEQNQSQLILSDKENKLKDQRLKQQAFIRNALLGGLLLFILLGVFVFRNLSLKRKNEKLAIKKDQAELQQKVSELEMQALRAQMNPHFIFNCLSSINRFIFKNDNKLASDYLTRFSRLIRMVLMHSQKKLIPLEDELEMLRLYLDLERLRFKDAFDYSITTTNIVDAGAIFIPPLLLQPFCENAVWHGLMHKETKGHLNINISEVINENEKVLHCVIEDDGVGREKAAEMKSKSAESEKSMGLKITTERLALLNQENNFSTFYKIEDVVNGNNEVAGTRVQLKIRHKESVEELV